MGNSDHYPDENLEWRARVVEVTDEVEFKNGTV
jgi:hypothetical protein